MTNFPVVPSTAADLRLVQLDHVDIDPDTLIGPGGELWDAIGTDRTFDVRVRPDTLAALPATGWRRVHVRAANYLSGASEMFAAPHAATPGEWHTVNLAEVDGRWIVSGGTWTYPVHPGRPTRREFLRLTWPDHLRSGVDTTPDLSIILTNVATRRWSNETRDSDYVRGWLLDEQGHRIEDSAHFVVTGSQSRPLPDLEPGESVTLSVHLAEPGADGLAADGYALDAMLITLDLRSEAGTLTLM